MATTQIIKTTGNDKKTDKYKENRKHIEQEQIVGTIPTLKTFLFLQKTATNRAK